MKTNLNRAKNIRGHATTGIAVTKGARIERNVRNASNDKTGDANAKTNPTVE
ncbi:MAG TPA: hypothetical protein VLB68_19250 [Pyrinomonadaceae bacterium]|nr:hypothetical protein [Pyrinomonadaceae bacterium]